MERLLDLEEPLVAAASGSMKQVVIGSTFSGEAVEKKFHLLNAFSLLIISCVPFVPNNLKQYVHKEIALADLNVEAEIGYFLLVDFVLKQNFDDEPQEFRFGSCFPTKDVDNDSEEIFLDSDVKSRHEDNEELEQKESGKKWKSANRSPTELDEQEESLKSNGMPGIISDTPADGDALADLGASADSDVPAAHHLSKLKNNKTSKAKDSEKTVKNKLKKKSRKPTLNIVHKTTRSSYP
ncbi:hypothetical protein MBANPS3_012554 [Mucor bainieri]